MNVVSNRKCCLFSRWASMNEARYVYLSLGEREEFAKNKAIAQVGNNVRWEYDHLQRTIGADNCTLEWNPGNHFQDNDKRLAKAFAWCINKLTYHHLPIKQI